MTSDTDRPDQLTPNQRLQQAMRQERAAMQALLAMFDPVHKAGVERMLDDIHHNLHSLASLAADGNDIVAIADAVSRYCNGHASTQLAHHAVNLTAQLERLEADTDG